MSARWLANRSPASWRRSRTARIPIPAVSRPRSPGATAILPAALIAFAGSNNVTNISGQIVNLNLFTVTGTNTYAATGTYPLNVTVTDPNNNSATVNPTARVAYPPLVVTGGASFNATAGVDLTNQTVATFTDPGLVANLAALGISDPTTQFSASINWGDGTSAGTGTITYKPPPRPSAWSARTPTPRPAPIPFPLPSRR